MTDMPASEALGPVVEHAELVEPEEVAAERPREEFIEQPAKVMRVGTMLKQLLDEVRSASLDEASRDRLRDIYETSLRELGSALSADLRDELGRLALPFGDDDTAPPSAAELQIAQAQLVGWLEGLIQGIQATLFAQQMQAQQQLANMRGQLPPGARPGPGHVEGIPDRPGTYL
jgi:hypothetical protein